MWGRGMWDETTSYACSSVEYFQCLCSILEEITLSHPNSTIRITGDFNLPDINWTNLTIDRYNYSIRLNQELWLSKQSWLLSTCHLSYKTVQYIRYFYFKQTFSNFFMLLQKYRPRSNINILPTISKNLSKPIYTGLPFRSDVDLL